MKKLKKKKYSCHYIRDNQGDVWISVLKASMIKKVHRRTILSWINKKLLPAKKIGSLFWMILLRDLEKFVPKKKGREKMREKADYRERGSIQAKWRKAIKTRKTPPPPRKKSK